MTAWRFDFTQLIDDNGDPLTSGYIETYQAGSGGATPKAAYQDKALTTPHALPAAGGIVLDSLGLPDTDTFIYLDCSSTFYLFKVYNSSGVLQWERDHIEGIKIDWDAEDYIVVANYAALGTGDHDGQTKLTADTQAIYSWDAGTTSWKFVATIPTTADATSLGSLTGVHDGQQVTCQDNGNRYTWDDGNTKWRVMSGNIYAGEPSDSTYTIETGCIIYDNTALCLKRYNGNRFEEIRGLAKLGRGGLQWSRTTATTFTVTAGMVRDDTDTVDIILPSAITKGLGAFAAGTGNGGFFGSGSLKADTWYHVWALYDKDHDGTSNEQTDIGYAEADAAGDALDPTEPSGYDYKARIASLLTDGSSQIVNITQHGDMFTHVDPQRDITGNIGDAVAHTAALSVPPDLNVDARIRAECTYTEGVYIILTATDQTDDAPVAMTTEHGATLYGYAYVQEMNILAIDQEIQYRASAAGGDLYVDTLGWRELWID